MRFSKAAETALLRYAWPGNVRELRNVVEQTVLLSSKDSIDPEHLPLLHGLAQAYSEAEADTFRLPPQGVCLEELERDLVGQALQRTVGNVVQAAKLLGLSRDALRYRISKYQLKSC